MAPLSAIDAIAPAIELTRQRLFSPARYGMWWRIALLGIFSGETSSGGNFNFRFPAGQPHTNHLMAGNPGYILAAVLIAATAAIVLFLLLTYIASVLRFVLFDAALTGRYRIREGWSRWRERSLSYFRLQLLIFVAFIVGLVISAGVPGGFAALRVLAAHKTWDATSVSLVVAAVLLTVAWIIGIAVFAVFSKDFVLPMMFLEGVDYHEGWSRLRPMLAAEKKSYTIYVLMKIVLALAAAVALGVVALITIVVTGIPAAVLGFAVYFLFKAQLVGTVEMAVLVLAIALFVLLVCLVVGTLSAPIAIFFPGYSMYYFAARYRPLWDAMNPAASPEAPSAPGEPAPAF